MAVTKIKPLAAIFMAGVFSSPIALAEQTPTEKSAEKAVESAPLELPNPLTLEALLQEFSHLAPALKYQQANIDLALANSDFNQAGNNLEFICREG